MLKKATIAIVITQLNIVACSAYPETFIQGVVVAPFSSFSVVIVPFPMCGGDQGSRSTPVHSAASSGGNLRLGR